MALSPVVGGRWSGTQHLIHHISKQGGGGFQRILS